MSKPANANELIDRYLQAVRFWLPKTSREEDLLAELGEDLRSQIEARESELGRALTLDEASAIVQHCGTPIVVAARLGPKNHLIGPALYPIYIFVLKMVLFWILVPVFLFILGPINVTYSNGDWGAAIGATIGTLWSGLFIAAGIITLVFAILERSQAHAQIACKFDPLSLPPVRKAERKTSPSKSVCEIVFALFGLMWLLSLPRYPVLILGPAASFLQASPILHTLYVPIVLLAVIAVFRPALVLAKPQWAWLPAFSELVQSAFTLIVINYLIDAAGHAPGAAWHPFVMLADSVQHSAQYIKTAAVVNASILLSLICAWIGLTIALIVHLWRLMRAFRKHPTDMQPATQMR